MAAVQKTFSECKGREIIPPRRFNPDTDGRLELVCLNCLCANPEDGYADVQRLSADLTRYLNGRPLEARKPGLADKLRRWWSQR